MDSSITDAVWAVVTVAGFVATIAWALWLSWRRARLDVHKAYVAGELAAVESLLRQPERYSLNTRVCMLIALGRYQAAIDAASRELPHLFEPPEAVDWPLVLVRLNVAEAFAELGQFEESLKLLPEAGSTNLLVRVGAAATHAWILTLQGHPDAALAALAPIVPAHLVGEYAAEPAMMHAWCLLNLGRVDEARVWLDRSRKLVIRASSDRNLLLLEARWCVMVGDLEGARARWREAREHRWSKQGGTGMLWFGDTLAAHGQADLAREVWAHGAQQDPEAWAAHQALQRLGSAPRVSPPMTA